MFTSFTHGLNVKKLMLTIFAVFVYVFVTDLFLHVMLLDSTYKATASLWRAESEMGSFFPFIILGQIVISKFFCVIFARGYEGRGITEGLRFGFLIGMFGAGMLFIQYATQPLPSNLLWAWILLGLVQYMGAGAVAALVYKR